MSSKTAEELRLQGNTCFSLKDYGGAEKFYTQAIIKDSAKATLFTNRALVRLKMNLFEGVITDCLKAIELDPESVKAYTNLGQAQLALGRPAESLPSSLKAYELAIAQRSPSIASIVATCLEAKKRQWEHMEIRRIERESELLRKFTDIIEEDADREVHKVVTNGEVICLGGKTVQEQEEEIRQKARESIRTLEDVFGKAEAERCAKRKVPDYLIDTISFSIMLDPVITKSGNSYDRSTLLDHLRRSETDPLTREPLHEKDLVPNLALKTACDQFLKENGWAVDW